ncbi:glycoside hydrolase family 95 protein [Gymnopilus junonius]|uniref:Glycoside hydrolase family 95 protein n=1 Tax=Gymnopilus junonius TaxID=109634 RepID=A0A9P5NYF0_GYMJU|nr:glycoside hydrolase family 95 protein [Gymnopilus junonius]
MWTSFFSIQLAQLLFVLFRPTASAPSGFPKSGNGLWYNQTGDVWSREWLPVGNGYLGATVPGGTVLETTQLNIESLWSGGPFADPTYNGGNKQPSEQAETAGIMQTFRKWIFQNVTGDIDNIDALTTDQGQYGSYAGAGCLLATLSTIAPISNYGRWLDLDQGLAVTSWTQGSVDLTRTTFCSNPTKACVQHVGAENGPLPNLTYAFSVALESGLPAPNITCQNFTSLLVNGFVSKSPPGMSYAIVFSAFATPPSRVQCIQFPVPFGSPPNATLQVITPSDATNTEAWITWIGDTEYDIDAGDSAHNFTFAGQNPVTKLQAQLPTSGSSNYQALLQQHTADIKSALSDSFALDLGQRPNLDLPTNVLRSQYTTIDGPQSNAYLDWLLFNYGRYLLVSSSRGVLPANLQGKWANGVGNAWSADANINLQMNYWMAEMTGLSSLTPSLFNYIEKTWAPRGAYTAQVLYNISRGWVVHDEMNIFGHTGMKGGGNTAEWADYPESAVWMMFHVWDHFDHTNDVAWWKAQGWPLVKGVASFHLEKLIPDLHFNDSTLVVAPCNSPEQAPITFGCAHAQQTIWQLFNAVEKGFEASGDNDTAFLEEIRSVRAKMDKGLRIGSWGQLQEWKVDQDSPTDTHRHLSHLVGLYPGYAITNFDPSSSVQGTGIAQHYTKAQILAAAGTSLLHRGNGTGPDADSGWEKAWRAAAWAQLKNTSMFYHELSFALSENFGPNLFSLYNPYDPDPIFQIDANFGFPAAVMNGLLQAPDVASITTPLTVTLLPTLPSQWPSGSIRGARLRGGITVSIQWSKSKLKSVNFAVDSGANVRERLVNVVYDSRVIASFTTSAGLKKSINL